MTEDAVKAASRSVMSAYDTGLREYGLFGQGRDEERNIRYWSMLLSAIYRRGRILTSKLSVMLNLEWLSKASNFNHRIV